MYDEDPYTITELVGRQATITRGSKALNRETQKFKRYIEKAPVDKAQKKPETKDEWEEELLSLPEPSEPSTVAPEEQVGTEARTEGESHETNQNEPVNLPAETANQTEHDQTNNTDSDGDVENDQRRSDRRHKTVDRYGDWDTSQRRKYTSRKAKAAAGTPNHAPPQTT